MKPWFEREADIIKFPEPEAEVIKLPDVAQYPDFITGVQDLKDKLSTGKITQEIHNKLYTDLIHRFMRKESFETPWFLREDQIDNQIDQLSNIAKQDPKKSSLVNQGLEKVSQFIQNLLGTKQVQQEAGIMSNVDVPFLKQQLAQAKAIGILTPQNKIKITNFLSNLTKQLTKQAQEVGFQQRMGIRQDIARAINLVAGKVNGTLEQLEALYKKQNQEGDKEVEMKTSPGADQIRKDITDIIRGLIERYKDQYKDPKQFQNFEQLILDFLNSSIKGIVPLSMLIKHGAGNIVDEVKLTKFKPLVDNNFIKDLLNKIPGKTSGNWGPGELGLAILGIPVSKGDKGDIQVGGETIELKASNNPQKGGRIGSEIVKSGKAGEQEYLKALDSFLKDVGQKRVGKRITGKKTYANGKTKDVAINALNVNQGWYPVINQYITNSKVSKERVSQFLSQVINSALNVAEKTITPNFSKSVNADRTINWDEFYKEYLRILLAYYNQVEGVNKILIIRPQNGNFRVVDATDINGIWKLIQDNKLAKSTHLINFSDSMAKLSPQIGIR